MLPVTLVTGIDQVLREAVAGRFLDRPGSVLVEYDLTGLAGGTVVRIARTRDGVIDREVVRMSHPCASCALRGSLVPLLVSVAAVDRYERAAVSVPAAGETQALVNLIRRDGAGEIHLDEVLTAVDSAGFVTDASGDELLRDRGVPTAAEDGRALAKVVVRQIESADVAVVAGDDRTAGALIQAINPRAVIRDLAGIRWQEPPETPNVRTLSWQANRPFHPERLYDALEDLLAGAVRGRGTVWLATRSSVRLGWDSFGTTVAIETLGPWLAELPVDRWSEVSEAHRARAALEWDAEHGDRGSYLTFVGIGLDSWELSRRLDGCVLRADEAAQALTDPFAPYLEGSTAA